MATFEIAVYGTLMAGERNEHWAEGALARRPCTLRGRLYDTGYGFPAFVPDEAGQEVQAELLTVTRAVRSNMDKLEGYPQLYHRETVAAKLGDGTCIQAMVYVMTTLPAGVRPIPSGDWRNR